MSKRKVRLLKKERSYCSKFVISYLCYRICFEREHFSYYVCIIQVKEDNQEISSIDKQTAEIEDKINKIRDEITNIEQDLDGHQGERNQKYLELKKKEETMDGFLNSFEEAYSQDWQRINRKESNNVAILEKMSRNLLQFENIPESLDLESMKNDLV